VTLKVVFMGSPEFGVPTLRALNAEFRVAGVVTRPDKPRGRSRMPVPTDVKKAALELQLPVIEPGRLDSPETMEALRGWDPDVIVVAAYGKMLPEGILTLPRKGCVNLHASLLPRHRGASPIAAAILAGDKATGVTTMLMDRGMDTGDILLTKEVPVREDDTAGSLYERLLEPGAELVVQTLRKIMDRSIRPVPQDHSRATYCKPLSREDGRLDWDLDAAYLARQVRAMNPAPGAFFQLCAQAVKVWEASHKDGKAEAGFVASIQQEGIAVGTGAGLLVLRQVQVPARKRISGVEFARGCRLKEGDRLG